MPNALLDEVAEDLVAKLEAPSCAADAARIYVQALGVVG